MPGDSGPHRGAQGAALRVIRGGRCVSGDGTPLFSCLRSRFCSCYCAPGPDSAASALSRRDAAGFSGRAGLVGGVIPRSCLRARARSCEREAPKSTRGEDGQAVVQSSERRAGIGIGIVLLVLPGTLQCWIEPTQRLEAPTGAPFFSKESTGILAISNTNRTGYLFCSVQTRFLSKIS